MVESKKVFKYTLKGTTKQLEKMYNIINCEKFREEETKKYFWVWVNSPYGIFIFPKRKYFVDYQNEKDYEKAIVKYGGVVGLEEIKAMEERENH